MSKVTTKKEIINLIKLYIKELDNFPLNARQQYVIETLNIWIDKF